MKKFSKKKAAPADQAQEKGAATREMEAIMDAAAESTAEIALLLDDGAPIDEPAPADTVSAADNAVS